MLQDSTQSQPSNAALAEELVAEEERAKVKAAAKKAKKQKQKANRKSLMASPSSVGPAADTTSPASISSSATTAAAGESTSLGMSVSNSSPSLDLERLTVSSEADTESARFLEELFCCPLTKVRPCWLQHLSDAFVTMNL